jgi:hypothetical protein
MRAFDWSSNDLGPTEHWPENLRVAVCLCLNSRFPIVLWWGPRLALLYNDACLTWLTEARIENGDAASTTALTRPPSTAGESGESDT